MKGKCTGHFPETEKDHETFLGTVSVHLAGACILIREGQINVDRDFRTVCGKTK